MDVVAERLDIPKAYGVPSTVHTRNLRTDARAVAHIESAESPVIVEGVAEVYVPDADGAERMAEASRSKYGYGPPATTYREGVWRLRPTVVLAWTVLHQDAIRFRFR